MFLVLVYYVGMVCFVTVKDIRVYFVAKINMKFIKYSHANVLLKRYYILCGNNLRQ